MKSSGSSLKRRASIVLAVTSAAVLGGFAVGTQAEAASLGTVSIIFTDKVGADFYQAGWSRAWEACRAAYPDTRSIELLSYFGVVSSPGAETAEFHETWSCLDTP
jgi:hypothetical protein